jgi:multidrug resistance efflux pump
LPAFIFGTALLVLALLWRGHIAAPTLTGQVEPVLANVSCYKPGTLSQLCVNRFQTVKTGDTLGEVLVTDPRILASSLAVIQADIEALRVGMQPLVARQRAAMDYGQLRLDWMRQRAQLAMARVNLQFAEADFRRTEALYKDKIVAERVYDQAKTSQDRLRHEVDELAKLVEEQTRNFEQITNSVDVTKLSDDPLRAALAVQESKLKLTEAELSPITLRAPVDGTVSVIFHRSGEAVAAGEPILSIAAANAVRIVGYIRPPVSEEPKVGSRVEVRTRGIHRQIGSATIIEVGSQFEPIAPALQAPLRFANLELGLPIGISIPPNLKTRPGELVDLRLLVTSAGN